jgi:hypothetical protein
MTAGNPVGEIARQSSSLFGLPIADLATFQPSGGFQLSHPLYSDKEKITNDLYHDESQNGCKLQGYRSLKRRGVTAHWQRVSHRVAEASLQTSKLPEMTILRKIFASRRGIYSLLY